MAAEGTSFHEPETCPTKPIFEVNKTHERKCLDCGRPIPLEAPAGFCPHCEMAGAIALSPVAEATSPTFGRPLRYFGDYELIDEIARGGMGVVYKARQISLNRTVAVKMILTGRRPMAVEVNRFRASTRAAAGLQHPNIVPIYEIGEQDGHDYFSMEFVEGPNLAQVVRDNPLPAARAANYVRTIAEAVHYAHERGVLHRDLKPSNILLDSLDQPRVTDFGLAKNLSSDPELTEAGQVLGAPSFIPPEQAAGLTEEVGRHSDVYALGGILYYLLTGHPPFAAETPLATIARVLHHDPVAPRKLNANIPQRLENICLKCLEKRPQRRYPTAKDLADELGRFQRNEPIQAGDRARRDDMSRPWHQRNYVVVGALTAIVLLLIGGVTYWRTRLPGTSARENAQSPGQTNKVLPQVNSPLQSAGGETNNPTQNGQSKVVEHEITGLHPQANKPPVPVASTVQPPIGNIHDAAESGDLEKVTALLAADPSLVNANDEHGTTPLFKAASEGHSEVVKLLLDKGASVDAKADTGVTPLLLASQNGHLEVVKLLLGKGAAIDTKAKNGAYSLFLAAEDGHLDVVELLLDKGAEINAKGYTGATPLLIAAKTDHPEVAKVLLEKGAAVDAKNDNGDTPLSIAAQNGHLEVVKLLLASHAAVDAKANDGGTPLLLASQEGYLDVVKVLLANGAAVNAAGNNGATSLFLAAGFKHPDVVKLLLDKGATVDAKVNNGLTPLFVAVDSGQLEAVRLLLDKGANPNVEAVGLTPLGIAEKKGYSKIADLLRKGVNH